MAEEDHRVAAVAAEAVVDVDPHGEAAEEAAVVEDMGEAEAVAAGVTTLRPAMRGWTTKRSRSVMMTISTARS